MHAGVTSKYMAVVMICILLAAGICSGGAWPHRSDNESPGQHVDDTMACAVANGFLVRHDRAAWTIEMVQSIASHDETLAYLVSLSPQGYIAVSAHRALPPVVAYSFTSPAPLTDDTSFLELLRADLSTRLEHLDRLPSEVVEQWDADWADIGNGMAVASFEQWPPEGSTSTGGWVETTWSQDAPYNQYCPLDTNAGERSVAGCPAVTMAQILTYHRTVGSARFNDSDDYLHNYNGLRYTIDDDHEAYDFPSFPVLNDRLDEAAARFEAGESLTEQDMAAVIFACGVAAEQVYSAAGSGTFGVGQADQAYQRFGIPHDLKQDGDVYNRLAMNMIHGLPAHLAVVNEDWTAGHNLVVDGYNTDDYFHLNYGWGGSYDGWYLLPQEMRFDLTVLEGIVLDILYAPEDADVYCPGSLHWTAIEPGTTVQGSIPVANVGAANSSLHWQVVEHPEWGTWTFEPSEGTLRAGESTSVEVTVTGPERSLRNYTGHVKIVNVDDPD
ncbi:MAG: C10 family peptidase, partial [Thermoplasmatota archaeon]